MAKLLGLDKLINLFKALRDNSGIFGGLRTLWRTDDLKYGTLVGVDKYGNKYYENNSYFYGRNRWVMYNKDVGLNFDGSQVPAEWFGWLHYKTDYLPNEDPGRPKYKWMADHTPNLTGSTQAYMPYTTTKPKVEAWKPPQ